jgi:4'-phosphopantetheinyl transferase
LPKDKDVALISKIVPESDCEIWIWEIKETTDYFCEHLSEYTLKGLSAYASDQRKRQFLAVRYLLKLAGKGEEIEYESTGKPFLRHGSISISHTPAYAGIYLSKKDVGLDIEAISPRILKIASRFLGEMEKKKYGVEDSLQLTLLWGAKEAIFKKHGGETTHFAQNIIVDRIDSDRKEMLVHVNKEGIQHSEMLSYQIQGNIVVVYTR